MAANFDTTPAFPAAAPVFLADPQLRANLRRATTTIRTKRDRLVAELPDFQQLRESAEAVKSDALGRLDELLAELERNVAAAGGTVHYAPDAAAARALVVGLVQRTGVREVVKVKSMTTAEIRLNEALEAAGIAAVETDLAELIIQLGNDLPSHIVVPAIHRNRTEIRDVFLAHMGEHGIAAPTDLSDEPEMLAAAARRHLRDRFLRARVAISSANFAIAETGSLVIVESEGNGRMCLTLPETLISVVGIEKVIPRFADLEIFLQLLARSATGERMNPYTSIFTGVHPGDGPREFHLVLVDNGRTHALADRVGRQALRCIRCAACLNVCPVYERVGGHAYGSVYPGPIGAVLTPQLDHVATDPVTAALPFASSLCGACFEVCPVRIDIPRLLVHLRAKAVATKGHATLEGATMRAAGAVLSSPVALGALERLGARLLASPRARRLLARLPGPGQAWGASRELPRPGGPPLRDWWRASHPDAAGTAATHRTHLSRSLPARVGHPKAPRPPGPSPAGERDALFGRIRAVRAASGVAVSVPRRYRHAGESGVGNPVALFAARVGDYRATVTTAEEEGAVAGIVTGLLQQAGARRVVVPAGLPGPWRPADGEVICALDDGRLGATELDAIDATVSGCAVAIAETGTIVLDGGDSQGRRALSLVPDHLVVVVRADQIVGNVPDALAQLAPGGAQTWISGPSATSDIELHRVEGVHGPRRLDVVIVAAPR